MNGLSPLAQMTAVNNLGQVDEQQQALDTFQYSILRIQRNQQRRLASN